MHPPVDFFDVYTDTFKRPSGGEKRRSAVADYNSCDFGQVYNDLLGGSESVLLAFFSRTGDLRAMRLTAYKFSFAAYHSHHKAAAELLRLFLTQSHRMGRVCVSRSD